MSRLLLLASVCATLTVSGCAGLTQMQDTAAKFDQSVHAVSTAELSLFHQVQAAECNRNFYQQGFAYATAAPDSKTHKYAEADSDLDLRLQACTPQELTDDEFAVREKLMQTITLYADSIQTLTNGTSDKNLSDASKALAGNIKDFAEQQKFTAIQSTATGALNTAVFTIATLILDHSAYKHVQAAAAVVQNQLVIVIGELQAENSADAIGLQGKADGLVAKMRAGVSGARDRFGAASFLNIVDARSTLQSLIIAPPDVAQLNATLGAVLKANEALSRTTNGGAIPEIADLTSRAQQAAIIFNAGK
jgi:hypothetical protein